MGLLDQVLGGVLGGGQHSRSGGAGTSPIVMAVMALLASRGGGLGGLLGGASGGGLGGGLGGGMGGGLGGLLDSFTRAGHGDVANSWVSSGPNRPIEAHQLEEALGHDTIESLTRQTGMPRQALLSELSMHLPRVVDQLTPHGRPPNEQELQGW